jgi:hypothetical protein
MPSPRPRRSPDGRPIRIYDTTHTLPTWLSRRRRAYRLTDSVAEQAKRAVRVWLLPRPRPRQQNATQ